MAYIQGLWEVVAWTAILAGVVVYLFHRVWLTMGTREMETNNT